MDYITPKETSLKWEISERRVQKPCKEDHINGVVHFGKIWAMPRDAEKPMDARLKSKKSSDIKNI